MTKLDADLAAQLIADVKRDADNLDNIPVLGQEINVLRPRTVHIPRICEDCAEDMR